MEFLLTGFTSEKDCRIYAFESMGVDRVWLKCTVRADLSLARKYGIALQELPLLCRGLLDQRDQAVGELIFTEDAIRTLASARAAAKAAIPKRKAPVRPAGEQLGAAWREQHPPATL